jgi:hypothetical protein
MHPLLVSGLLFVAGVAVVIAGRVWRRGRQAVCRACGFHLAGLRTPSACPECGRDLSRRRAIASGDRRGWPKAIAVGLTGLAVISLGYAMIDNPATDRRKPLWMLEVERRVFGESRDARTHPELKRRMDAVPADPAEQLALGKFAVSRAASPGADLVWHGLAVRAMRSQWVSTESAAELARAALPEMLRTSPSDEAVLVAAAETYFPHAGIGWTEMTPLIDRVASTSRAAADAEQGSQAWFAWLRSPERRMLSAWAESAWHGLTIDQRNRLTGSESASYTLVVPRRIVAGAGLPYRIETRRQPLISTTTQSLWSTKQWGGVRIDDTELTRPSAHVPTGFRQHSGIHNDDNGSMGTTTMFPVPSDRLGPAEVVAEIRTGYDVGDDSSVLRRTLDEWPLITLATQTEVLPAGSELPEPETASAETINAVLDCLALRFEWVEGSAANSEPRLDLNAMFRAPTLALDHNLIVIQDGIEFDGGSRVSFAANVSGRGYGMWIHADSARHRHLTRERQPVTRFDPERPFTILLVPDEFTRWEEGVVSQRIPLGTYVISRQQEVDQGLAGNAFDELPARLLAVALPEALADEID